MARALSQYHDADGVLVHEEWIDVPDVPVNHVEQLQAQIDALTDITLGGHP